MVADDLQPLEYKVVRVISESHFSQLVELVYGRPYRLQQGSSNPGYFMGQMEVCVIQVPTFSIPDAAEMEEWERWRTADVGPAEGETGWEWRMRWERGDPLYAPLDPLVEDLASKGLLEEGTYHVMAEW